MFKYIKCIFIGLFFIFQVNVVFADSDILSLEYNKLYQDLKHTTSIGYKSQIHLGSDTNKSQGMIINNKINYYVNTNFNVERWPVAMAIRGKGFFKVYDVKQNRSYYTRNGEFYIDNRGYIVNHDGFTLQPEIKLSSSFIRNVYIDEFGNNIIVVDFENEQNKPNECIKYVIKLYLPVNNENIIQNGIYYEFKGEQYNGKYSIEGNAVELSTSDPIAILLRMKFILLKGKNDTTAIKDARVKIQIIELLLKKIQSMENGSDNIEPLKGINRNIIIEALPLLK